MGRDLLCFSHLRWDFVYQRPNHLMARAARERRVFFIEEPVEGHRPQLELADRGGVTVVVPHLPADLSEMGRTRAMRGLVSDLVDAEAVRAPVLWYYTPMALPWTSHLRGSVVVYDVMDELSQFRFAPAEIRRLEEQLLSRAHIVTTGGRQLFETKRSRHSNVHLFPSSVDVTHFARARATQPDPADQAAIPRPRVGYFGVIDERIDLDLIRKVAARRPEWQVVLVGPIAKIDPAELPRADNIHHLGPRPYAELPAYLAGWDVAIMPFALNESTRHISPTKTPEYLAGGRPVASTPIRDVVEPYGNLGLVAIGEGAEAFERAVEQALATDLADLRHRADGLLASTSWDSTWTQISNLIDAAARRQARPRVGPVDDAVPAALTRPSLGGAIASGAARGSLAE